MAATRWYFPDTGTAPVSPSASTSWNDTTQFDRVAIGRSHKNETSVTKTAIFNGSTPAFVLMRQFVSGPLVAQTISGNIKGQIRGITSQAAKLGMLAVAIRIVQNSGADYGTPKTLLAATAPDLVAVPPEFATTLTNRQFQTAAESATVALTSQAAEDGDRLVIELGVRDTTNHATRTLGLSFGGTATVDLAEDQTTTTANYPWIEFDSALLLYPIETLKLSDTVTAKRYGDATPADEALHITDGPIAVALGRSATVPADALKVTDSVTAAIPAAGFDAIRANIIAGLDSAQAEATGWDAVVKATLPVSAVVRTSDTVVTITLPAFPTYDITSQETITATIPAAALVGNAPIVATPSFTIDPDLNLARAVGQEALTVTDTVTPALQLATSIADALTLLDGPTTQRLDPLERTLAEPLVLSDSVSAQLTPLQQSVTEALSVVDTLFASATPAAALTESVRIADGPVVAFLEPPVTPQTAPLGPRPAAPALPPVRAQAMFAVIVEVVAESWTPILPVYQPQPSPAPRPFTAIPLLPLDLSADLSSTPEALKITDSISAALSAADLATSIGEALRISDPGRIDVWGVLHITDGPVVSFLLAPGDLAIAIADETLKLADTVSAQLTPLQQSASETLRISHAVSAQLTPLQQTATENLRIADLVTAQLTPLEQSATESLRISDGPTLADLNPRPVLLAQEAIKISDGPVLAELITGQLLVAVADETLKLSDLVTAQLTPLQQSATESLRISDSITAQLTPLQQTASESLRISDGPVLAVLDLSAAVAQEALRISDSVAADENPRPVLIDAENLKITDGPVATGAGLSQVVGPEALRITEVLQAELTLLQTATPAESLRITDAVSAELTPLARSVSEALRITDGPVLASIGLSVAVADESLRITDTVFADENPRPILVAQEALRITDTPTVVISGNLIAPIASENLKLSDVVTAQLTPLLVAIPAENLKISDAVLATRQQAAMVADETLRISDTVTAALGHLEAAPATEHLRISDVLTASLTLLEVSLTETVYISDAVLLAFIVSALPATPDLVELDATIRRTVILEATLSTTVTIDIER